MPGGRRGQRSLGLVGACCPSSPLDSQTEEPLQTTSDWAVLACCCSSGGAVIVQCRIQGRGGYAPRFAGSRSLPRAGGPLTSAPPRGGDLECSHRHRQGNSSKPGGGEGGGAQSHTHYNVFYCEGIQ
ncbi:hypothetical protein AAFF_G00263500 [Aldrovandia affinis]|uniref:Uncharacterized protein n=1 Tax=Aldrovandia affinis TaxID=143900 RepID=A0AAD7SSP0_9TELE|nr:hypothetical protein AAFF_G00263500 [Aldrovandia affinis]